MKIGILRFGKVEESILNRIREDLQITFPKTKCTIIDKTLPLPEEAYNSSRQQYHSSSILREIQNYAEKNKSVDRILGILDVDIYTSELNFVFGEAECPGKAALISLWRLRPEFYGEAANMEVFMERCVKEAVHEIGHTLGLKHCLNPFCVMYFSNSIFDTDRKQSLFCNKCQLAIEKI